MSDRSEKKALRRETMRYLLVGILTAVVNLVTFFGCTYLLEVNYLLSNLAALVTTAVLGYIANKLFVFRTPFGDVRLIFKEFRMFVYARLFSSLVDMLLLWVLVAGFGFHQGFIKILNSGVVVALNYIFSKLIIFKKPN